MRAAAWAATFVWLGIDMSAVGRGSGTAGEGRHGHGRGFFKAGGRKTERGDRRRGTGGT